MLYPSRYNFFVDRVDGVVGYNSRTGAIAYMEACTADKIRGSGIASELQSDDVQSLLEMGFLHEGNELALVLQRMAPLPLSRISFVIAPTLDCNRSCPYCYQNEYRNSLIMSEEIQRATVEYIEELTSRLAPGAISCTWYGGEPLLAKELVYSLTKEIRTVAKEKGVDFLPPQIITNGDFLDIECQAKLVELEFNFIQISIDSLVDDGKGRRGVFMSDGRYSPIIQNAMSAACNFDVLLRVNVTKRLVAELPEILSALRACGLDRHVDLARAEDLDGEAGAQTLRDGSRFSLTAKRVIPINQLIDPETLSRRRFAELKRGHLEEHEEYLDFIQGELSPAAGSVCGATEGNMFVIDANGDVSRCWNSAHVKSEAVDNVLTRRLRSNASDVWQAYRPGDYEACAKCRVLPLCKAGCSHPRLFAGSKYPPCTDIKYNVDAYVEYIGSRLVCAPKAEEHPS